MIPPLLENPIGIAPQGARTKERSDKNVTPKTEPWPSRKFDGKVYEFASSEVSKAEAQRTAKKYRKQGFNARITRDPRPGGWGKEYRIWTRARLRG